MSSGSFKNVMNKICLHTHTHIYIYIYKQDLALNNLQWFICLKTKHNQTKRMNKIIRQYSFVYKTNERSTERKSNDDTIYTFLIIILV